MTGSAWNRNAIAKDGIAIAVAVIFLGLGFTMVWFTKSMLVTLGDTVLVALLLLPILLYTILSGRLKELGLPGGVSAKFIDLIEMQVDAHAETIEGSVQEIEAVAKGGPAELERLLRQIDDSRSIVLTLTLGNEYMPGVMRDYINMLSQFRNFRFVAFLNQVKQFEAYVPASTMKHILGIDSLDFDFLRAVYEGKVQVLRRFPGVVTRTVSTKNTNRDALNEMVSQETDALIVIDENRRLRGVVEREQILSKMMLALAK